MNTIEVVIVSLREVGNTIKAMESRIKKLDDDVKSVKLEIQKI